MSLKFCQLRLSTLKLVPVPKKKGGGSDGNEVSPLKLLETAFQVEDAKELIKIPVLNVKAKEVMTTPESKNRCNFLIFRRMF